MLSNTSLARRRWIYVVILLLIFIMIGYFTFSTEAEEYPDYVAESPSPTGLKGLYTYFEKEGIPVDIWSHPPERLAKKNNGDVFIIIEPLVNPGRDATKEYEDFMEAGNTILLIKQNPVGILGLETSFIDGFIEEEPKAIFDERNDEYKGILSSIVRVQANEEDDVLLSDDEGAVAIKRDYEQGQLIVVNAPEWFINDQILEHDHLALLSHIFEVALEDDVALLFDDYSHITDLGSSFFEIYPKWLLVFAFQAGLLTLMWLWYKGKRFGAIVTPREEIIRYSNEQVNALAAWYQRGREYQSSLNIQADYVKMLLQEKYGVPYHVDWLNIEGQLKRVWKDKSNKDIQAFLHGISNMLQTQDINKKEYLYWSNKLDQLRKEVEEG